MVSLMPKACRFGTRLQGICGHGPHAKTFLLPDEAAKGEAR